MAPKTLCQTEKGRSLPADGPMKLCRCHPTANAQGKTEHSTLPRLSVKQNSHSRTGPEILGGIVAIVNIARAYATPPPSDAEGHFSLDLMMWGQPPRLSGEVERAALAHHGWKFWQWAVDLVRALKLSPQSFDGQAGQGIRRSIRKHRRTDAKREMKGKTRKHNWASEPGKSPHRFG